MMAQWLPGDKTKIVALYNKVCGAQLSATAMKAIISKDVNAMLRELNAHRKVFAASHPQLAMKKGLNQPALLSFFYETVLLSPFALIVLIRLETTGRGAIAMAAAPWQFAVLALCGFVTAIPLILFGESANKAGLFATGLIGYLSPTITLFLSIFVFHEPFDLVQLAAFAIIWVGLGFFTYGELKE